MEYAIHRDPRHQSLYPSYKVTDIRWIIALRKVLRRLTTALDHYLMCLQIEIAQDRRCPLEDYLKE